MHLQKGSQLGHPDGFICTRTPEQMVLAFRPSTDDSRYTGRRSSKTLDATPTVSSRHEI
ncbi:hypothetical protein ACFPRL_06420 [Pseudoclavibacter helvolus]